MPIDLNTAIQFGLLEQVAENVDPANLNNAAGTTVNINYDSININYRVVTTFYGNDLATDMNPERGNQIVSFGLIVQAPNNDLVVAIRGTDGIWEWVHDAEFLTVPCPFRADAGLVEDGFTALYQSLRIGADPASIRLVDYLKTLPQPAFRLPIGSVTIIGHSLGGALATLLGLDVATNTAFKNPTVYTYASPRAGDPKFAGVYNQSVPNTWRIANRMDLVPKLPLPPLYDHVNTLSELTTVTFNPLPKVLVKLELGCEHHITTYLYLLSLAGKGTVLPLDSDCTP